MIPERDGVIALHSELAHLGEVAMFVLLGVAITRVDLSNAVVDGVLIALAMMVVIRPLLTFPTLRVFRYTRGEAAFGSLAGLRGAVPILLASLPRGGAARGRHGHPRADGGGRDRLPGGAGDPAPPRRRPAPSGRGHVNCGRRCRAT